MILLTDFEAREVEPSSELIAKAETLQDAIHTYQEDPFVRWIGDRVVPQYERTREAPIYKRALSTAKLVGAGLLAMTVKAPKNLEISKQKRAFKKQLKTEAPYLFSAYGNLSYHPTYFAKELLVAHQTPVAQTGEA